MSEVQSRPAAPRGRGSGRGGRGGFASRGSGRSGARPATNGDSKHDTESSSLPTLEDEGEIGRLKKLYGSKVAGIKELFPDWSEVDILFALQETDGDENLASTRILEGKTAAPFPDIDIHLRWPCQLRPPAAVLRVIESPILSTSSVRLSMFPTPSPRETISSLPAASMQVTDVA